MVVYVRPDSGSGESVSSVEPTVSIVLPTYNRRALLGEAIASIVAQTFHDWELIVADDGSTDGTAELVRAIRDARIRLLVLPHRGTPAVPRAAALRVARGQWVAFLDSDDLWATEKLERQLHELDRNPHARWSYTAYALTDMSGRVMPAKPPRPFVAASGWIVEQLLTFGVSAALTTVMARRSLIEEVGGIDEATGFRDDYDLVLRLAARSATVAVPETLTTIREHSGRTSTSHRRISLLQDNERVFRKCATATGSDEIRALSLRQCAVQLAAIAREHSRNGQHRMALSALSQAVRDAPFAAPVWRATARWALDAARMR
jgi:glycosyltransferase involved in cell wall biosynthesis